MAKDERNIYTIQNDAGKGEVKIADEVVAIIAALAATEVEGVASMAGNITNELISRLGMKNLSKGVKVDVLEGVVTNVTAFGAFVDIGVHQDGLVHISALSEKFVTDPHQIVKSGQLVRVRVLDVDVKRRRIGLSMVLAKENEAYNGSEKQAHNMSQRVKKRQRNRADGAGNAMAEAFAKLGGKF